MKILTMIMILIIILQTGYIVFDKVGGEEEETPAMAFARGASWAVSGLYDRILDMGENCQPIEIDHNDRYMKFRDERC